MSSGGVYQQSPTITTTVTCVPLVTRLADVRTIFCGKRFIAKIADTYRPRPPSKTNYKKASEVAGKRHESTALYDSKKPLSRSCHVHNRALPPAPRGFRQPTKRPYRDKAINNCFLHTTRPTSCSTSYPLHTYVAHICRHGPPSATDPRRPSPIAAELIVQKASLFSFAHGFIIFYTKRYNVELLLMNGCRYHNYYIVIYC